MLPKQSISFPEVAILRKGTPKRTNPKKPGTWMQGLDLNHKFRIAFAPGTEDARQAFEAAYPQAVKVEYGPQFAEPRGYEVTRLKCMMMTQNVADSWEWWNEAYNAGRLIARADDTHFITYRNPLTGAYEVTNGEPYKEFEVGQSIVYEREDGRKVKLPIRTHGRLKLFLPDLRRMVQFTLKTTSYYDRLSISSNLAAIQFLANTLNGGNAAGIPFYIYRQEQDVAWNKEDGSAQRIGKWLVRIEADPEWVESAVGRVTKFALGEGISVPQALLMAPMAGAIDPNDSEDEAQPGPSIDAEYSPGPAPESEYTPEPEPAPTQETEADKEEKLFRDALAAKTPGGRELGSLLDSQLDVVAQNKTKKELAAQADLIIGHDIKYGRER